MIKYIIPFFFIGILSCSLSPKTVPPPVVEQDSESIFKSWLKDTLPEFIRWKESESISTRNLSFTDDSLVFTVSEKFMANVSSEKSSVPQVQNILNLFSEYDELTDSEFKLTFITRLIFEPSGVEGINFNLIEEIDSIYVSTPSQEINYTLIRGRLFGKKTTNLKDPSITKETEFIWDGEILKKVDG